MQPYGIIHNVIKPYGWHCSITPGMHKTWDRAIQHLPVYMLIHMYPESIIKEDNGNRAIIKQQVAKLAI